MLILLSIIAAYHAEASCVQFVLDQGKGGCETLSGKFVLDGCTEWLDRSPVFALIQCGPEGEATALGTQSNRAFEAKLKKLDANWSIVGLAETPIESPLDIQGQVRFRGELRDNVDFKTSTPDPLNLMLLKARLTVQTQVSERLQILIEPQGAHVFGEKGVTLQARAPTQPETRLSSGGLYDPYIRLHRAFLAYESHPNLTWTLGRQTLSYGDELILGALEWDNSGRSFDALKLRNSATDSFVDIFWSKIDDKFLQPTDRNDTDLYGVYARMSPLSWAQELDGYFLYLADTSIKNHLVSALGLRIKSKSSSDWDYRSETTLENVDETFEYQSDIESGFTFSNGIRLSAEWFRATKGFRQMYPTWHKFLGYADLWGRRNIWGYRFGFESTFSTRLKLLVDLHSFFRVNLQEPAYRLEGIAYEGITGHSGLGRELDITLSYTIEEHLALNLGCAVFVPGMHVKKTMGASNATFAYLELSATF